MSLYNPKSCTFPCLLEIKWVLILKFRKRALRSPERKFMKNWVELKNTAEPNWIKPVCLSLMPKKLPITILKNMLLHTSQNYSFNWYNIWVIKLCYNGSFTEKIITVLFACTFLKNTQTIKLSTDSEWSKWFDRFVWKKFNWFHEDISLTLTCALLGFLIQRLHCYNY